MCVPQNSFVEIPAINVTTLGDRVIMEVIKVK